MRKLLKPNAADIPGIVDFAGRYGIRHIFYRICDPRGWSDEERARLLKSSFGEVRDNMRKALALARRAGIETNLAGLLRTGGDWRFIYESGSIDMVDTAKKPVCLLPWLHMFASVTGATSCCCSIYPSGEASLGHAFEGEARATWNSARWQELRRLFKEKKNYNIFEGCSYCIPMSRRHLFSIVRLFPGYLRRLIKGGSR